MATDLKALRALLDKATPGPWEANGQRVESIATVAFCGESTAVYVDGRHRHINTEEANSNAALIAAAVNALPALLNEVEALRAAADPETLRFVRVAGAMSSTSRAITADGEIYTIYVAAGGEWGFDRTGALRPVYPFATEGAAIEAARAHDRQRRGVK